MAQVDPQAIRTSASESARTVAIVAADEIFARRVAAVAARAGVETLGREASVQALLASRGGEAPDVLVVATGADVAADLDEVRRLAPRALTVVVALEPVARTAREAIAAGADAVVAENELEAALGGALESVSPQHLVLPRSVADALGKPVLSARERQVAGMVVLGLTNSEIAARLHLAETTVKSHLTSIFRKLGVRSRSEASARILDPRDGLGVGVLSIASSSGLDVVDHL